EPSRRPPSARAVASMLPPVDPLAIAKAAGLTPSPREVATAPAGGGFTRLQATALVSFMGLTTLAVTLISYRLGVHAMQLEMPPGVLESSASRLIGSLVPHARPVDRTYGFIVNRRLVDYLKDHALRGSFEPFRGEVGSRVL